MTKNISTLVSDIYNLFDGKYTHEFSSERVESFGKRLATHVVNRINEERRPPTLRMSNIGTVCKRKLWYTINTPEKAEEIPPEVKIKFLFGNILEELLLFLSEEAGHKVEGQQDEISLYGVTGHRDAIIDGVLIDAKSASSRSYVKFDNHLSNEMDAFGYIRQLNSYLKASEADSKLVSKEFAGFLVIDKQLGKICLDIHTKDSVNYEREIASLKEIISKPTPPPRGYSDEPDGKSGNMKLGVECSYCPFKLHCWPNIRVYFYSNGPRFLTKVVREPKVDSYEQDKAL